MLALFLYYVFYASAVLIYGVGLSRSLYFSENRQHIFLKACKMLFCVFPTSALSFLLVNTLLVPYELAELYPFVVLLIFIVVSVFIEAIIRITVKLSAVEFCVALMFCFISLTESVSLLECVLISMFSIFSFFIFIPVLHSIYHRMEVNKTSSDSLRFYSIIASLVVILFIFLSWNVSWLNKGVFQW